MIKNLYFLPKIADALAQQNPRSALIAAFKNIEALGHQPGYEQGYMQFQRFIAEIKESYEKRLITSEAIILNLGRVLAQQLAYGIFEGDQDEMQAALDLIVMHPSLKNEYEIFCKDSSESDLLHKHLDIYVERNKERIGLIPLYRFPIIKELRDVKPGFFVVRLCTGRLIWEGELYREELVWTAAFPEQDIELAADTGDIMVRMTREIKLFNNELTIQVFPGIEDGRMRLKVRKLKIV